jgi:membrane protease YdiL (CAAX protease family)
MGHIFNANQPGIQRPSRTDMSLAPEQPNGALAEPLPQSPERPAEQPADPKPDRRVGQVYLLLACCAGLMIPIVGVISNWSFYVAVSIDQPLLFFLPAVLFARSKGLPVAAALRWRPISPAAALLSVLLGTGGCAIALGIALLVRAVLGPGSKMDLVKTDTVPHLAVTLFCAALLPGICEETMFRGLMLGTLGRLGAVKSVLITSLLFALLHFNPRNFLGSLFFGVVFGIVTLRTRSTFPAMIAHVSGNATAFTIAYLVHHRQNWVVIGCLVLAPMFVVGFLTYLVKTRHQKSMPGPLASVPAALSEGQRTAAIVLTVLLGGFLGLAALGWWIQQQTPTERRFGSMQRDDQLPTMFAGDRV